MKKFYFFIMTFLITSGGIMPQHLVERAYLGPDGEVLKESIVTEMPFESKTPGYNQLPGWPKKVVANQTFKPFRGVTLADITQNGQDEILVAGHNMIHVFDGSGNIIWSRTLTGTAIYPPSVGIMDENGTIGIVQVTGGVPNNGRVYYFDSEGNDMTGWPLSFANHWIICAPVIADVSGNGICEIIVQTRTSNNLHVLQTDGTPLNANWPVNLDGTPAITPSVADIDNDGNMEIVTAISNGTLFAFDQNGQSKPGFPVPSDNYGFSYQSPLLVDFDGNDLLSIVGSTHGDAPKFYVRNHDGTYRDGWPVPVPEGYWTYSPPTVVDLEGNQEFNIFMSRPTGEDPLPMLYGFNPDGTLMDNFPITKSGGLEGFISVADIDIDGVHDLVFGSNMMIDGEGFIHAWYMDGSGELPGFPLRPTGFTFMNGPNLGDVNGDGLLNLVALSYEQNFLPTDSTFINVYNLNIPVEQANVLFGTYKGSNDRSGFVPRYIEQAELVIDPSSFSFGELAVGQTSEPETFVISNSGNAAATISAVAIGGLFPDHFVLEDTNEYPFNLGPSESIMVEVQFSPLSEGFKTAQLQVSANVNVPSSVISGTGIAAEPPVIVVDPLEFYVIHYEGAGTVCEEMTIMNTGVTDLNFVMDIEYFRSNWLSLSDTIGTIEAGNQLVVDVCFDSGELPSELYFAQIHIQSNDPENPIISIDVLFSIITDIGETINSTTLVYPIPASDAIYIESDQPMVSIKLTSYDGQVIISKAIAPTRSHQLKLEGITSGIYILQVMDDKGWSIARKVIVQLE